MNEMPSFDYAPIEAAINAVHGCLHIKTTEVGIGVAGFEEYETEFAGWSPTLHDIRIHVTTPHALDDLANATVQDLLDDLDRHFEKVKKIAALQQRRSAFAASIDIHQPIMLVEKEDAFFDRILIDRSHAERLLANERDPAGYLHRELMSLYNADITYGGAGDISKGQVRIIEHEAGRVEYLMQHDISSRSRVVGNFIAIDHEMEDAIPDAAFSAAIGRPVQQLIDLPAPYAGYYANRIITDVRRPLSSKFFYIELEKDFVTFGDLKT